MPYPASFRPQDFAGLKQRFKQKKTSGKRRGSFHSGLKPRRMKSRVKRLTESEKRRRGRKKEGGREGAGKPDSEREGDWEGEEARVPERMEGEKKKPGRRSGPRDSEREGGVRQMKLSPRTVSGPWTEHHLLL